MNKKLGSGIHDLLGHYEQKHVLHEQTVQRVLAEQRRLLFHSIKCQLFNRAV